MSNFYFLCITQPTNLGDLIINKMLVEELCRYGKVYVDAYNTPEYFKRELLQNKEAIDLYVQKRITAKKFNIIRLFLFARKNRISFYTSSPGPIEGGNKFYNFALMWIKLIFRLAGAKVYCIGGCCSSMVYSNKIFKNRFVNHYYVRSDASVIYLNKFLKGQASFIPDLAFLMRFYFNNQINNDIVLNKQLLVNFREPENDASAFLLWCQELIKAFCDAGYKVLLYYQVKIDYTFMNKLYQSTQQYGVEFREEMVWISDLSIYQNKGAVLSNRLHSIISGALFNAIPIACISNARLTSKIKDVLDSSLNEVADTIYAPYYAPIKDVLNIPLKVDKSLLAMKIESSAHLCREVIKKLQENE